MNLFCISRNHKNTPIHIRETLKPPTDLMIALLQKLNTNITQEAVFLATCNRTELYAVGDVNMVLNKMGLLLDSDEWTFDNTQIFHGTNAVEHLFRVAGGLDSAIIGETEVFGQVKEAYRTACEANTSGYYLHDLFHHAFRVSKRIRCETKLSEGSVSAGSLAVDIAERELGDLSTSCAVVVGAGEISTRMIRRLIAKRIKEIRLVNRTESHAEKIAEKYNVKLFNITELHHAANKANLIFTATAAPHTIIYPHHVTAPCLIFDLALPRDVHTDVVNICGVKLWSLDDIVEKRLYTLEVRKQAASEAESIVLDESNRYKKRLAERQSSPAVCALIKKADLILEEELSRYSYEEQVRMRPSLKRVLRKFLNTAIESIKGKSVMKSTKIKS